MLRRLRPCASSTPEQQTEDQNLFPLLVWRQLFDLTFCLHLILVDCASSLVRDCSHPLHLNASLTQCPVEKLNIRTFMEEDLFQVCRVSSLRPCVGVKGSVTVKSNLCFCVVASQVSLCSFTSKPLVGGGVHMPPCWVSSPLILVYILYTGVCVFGLERSSRAVMNGRLMNREKTNLQLFWWSKHHHLLLPASDTLRESCQVWFDVSKPNIFGVLAVDLRFFYFLMFHRWSK